MIIVLLGKAGSGKTTIAGRLEKKIKDCFIIDGDDLREETKNSDIGLSGREQNMHLGFSRAKRLSDLGFTVVVAMQAPIREIREQYLSRYDKQYLCINNGPNPKDEKGYNKNFDPDYDGISGVVLLQDNIEKLMNKLPHVLVPARFQTMHSGHKVIFEEARRISPRVTVALRTDPGDIIPLEENKKMIKRYTDFYGFDVIESPQIDEDWTNFSEPYDIYVQGNPVVIEKFKDSKIMLHHVPRYGSVSATGLRESIKSGKDVSNKVDKETLEQIKKII